MTFHKIVGSGNDFILIDHTRATSKPAWKQLAVKLCDRKRGIGADGILVVLPSKKADARMRIFNPDGSEADMCGNGLRCFAWYLYLQNKRKKERVVETGAGLILTRITGHEQVRLYLTPPKNLDLNLALKVAGKVRKTHHLDTGVPHAVWVTSNIEKQDVEALGPLVRGHRHFKPAGANFNLMQIDSPHKIQVRTYERGVETETLACGTGSTACALVGNALGKLKSPVKIKTASGEFLKVGFQANWEDLYLEGPARIVFQGETSQ